MDNKIILFIPLGIILVSLLFFSRGILICLTIICLQLTVSPSVELTRIGLQLRWVFFALFCFHVFGDIFLGRTVRKIKFFDILAVIFIIYAFLSNFYSPYPSLTLERATTILVLYISVFWIIWKYAYERTPERVARLILQILAPLFIAGYLMIFIGPHRPFLQGRFTGIYGNPNTLGVISAIVLPLSLWQFVINRKKANLFLFFLIFLNLLLCRSRGPLFATFFSLGYFIYARFTKQKPLVMFILLSFIFILTWILDTVLKQFFLEYIRVETITTGSGRLELWPIVVDLIMDKPVFGYGFGVEEKLILLKGIILHRHSGAYVHNSYLGMLVQLGILGFVIFFIPLFTLLFKELFSRLKDEKGSLLRYALRSSLIAGLMCGIYESWIYSVGNGQAFPFWIIVMLLIFCRYQDNKEGIASG